jgi:ABC-2 type transport system permease protein
MILTLRKPIAFVIRDFIDETSYQLAFALRFTNVIFFTFVFYFLSKLIDSTGSSHLEIYGGDYFSFALIGIGFTRYFSSTLNSLRTYLRNAQLNGTLEALLATQTTPLTIIFSSMLYPFLYTSMEVAIIFFIGGLLGVDIYWSNLPVAMVVLFVSLVSFACLGIMSGGFIIIFKRGDPITRLSVLASQLLAGEVFPITVLPQWMQFLSLLLPITHALHSIRLALLQNYSLEQLAPNILIILLFDVILIPVSIIWFKWAIKRAKADGSLSQY